MAITTATNAFFNNANSRAYNVTPGFQNIGYGGGDSTHARSIAREITGSILGTIGNGGNAATAGVSINGTQYDFPYTHLDNPLPIRGRYSNPQDLHTPFAWIRNSRSPRDMNAVQANRRGVAKKLEFLNRLERLDRYRGDVFTWETYVDPKLGVMMGVGLCFLTVLKAKKEIQILDQVVPGMPNTAAYTTAASPSLITFNIKRMSKVIVTPTELIIPPKERIKRLYLFKTEDSLPLFLNRMRLIWRHLDINAVRYRDKTKVTYKGVTHFLTYGERLVL